MSDKPAPTLADYVVTAISPALIAGLVGSLVFFLAEILYSGRYEGRLLWTLFFFVVGIVLVARISIEVDHTRAAFYGLALAVVSWIALMAFVDYPPDSAASKHAGAINFILMAVVWWCAHKLTCDCTYIDEKRASSSQGLLAAAGFEPRQNTIGQSRQDDLRSEEKSEKPKSFWKRWERFRERRRKRPHAPGLTVIWFSLAALPIFGLGQSLIPGNEAGRRAFAFWLAVCYVGCALGLLLTTSFLGLRRYLRQRKLPMPKAMTGVWLGFGAALVLAFLLVGALIPRPYSETPIWNLKKLTSANRDASKNAQLEDSSGKGESRASGRSKSDDPEDKDKGKQPDDAAKNTTSGDKNAGENKGSREGEEKSGEQRSASNPDRRFPDTKLGNALENLVNFLKWVFFILIALIVLAIVFRGALKYLGNFMPGARRLLDAISAWWARLFGFAPAVEAVIEAPKVRRKTFGSFSNPFTDGTGGGRSTEDLIEYSFNALEAWAADRNHPRRRDETALEFGSRLCNTFSSLDGTAQELAILVVRLAFANGQIADNARETLEKVWEVLTDLMPEPAR